MPLSKSSRSSKSSGRPSLLSSLSSRSVNNLLYTAQPSKEQFEPLGQPAKEETEASPIDDESGLRKPERRKSRLNVLTSLFHTSSATSTKTLSAANVDVLRPKTAHETTSSHIREHPSFRKPVASTIETTTNSSIEDSPKTSSNPHDSVSTIDNSTGALATGTITPATQVSDFDFGGLGIERTESPEEADQTHESQSTGADMPALIQKQPKVSGESPQRPPPLPPKVPVAQEPQDTYAPETPTSPQPPRSRGSEKRSSSAHPQSPIGRTKLQSSKRPTSPSSAPRARSSSANPPTSRVSQSDHNRTVSTPLDPRPTSKHSNDGDGRGRLRRSWLPGGRSSSGSKDLRDLNLKDLKKMPADKTWIMSPGNHADYNISLLTSGEKVPELWNENGSVYVHLFPKSSGKGPSFKVPTHSIEASIVFHELIQGELESSRSGRARGKSFDGRGLEVGDASRMSQMTPDIAPGEVRLYLPAAGPQHANPRGETGQPSLQRLIAIRNLFAFLTGQPLVGNKVAPTIFAAFLEISALMKEFDFMSMDGTTWGEAVDMSFGFYIGQLALADVRHSREKTLEGVILGERMKCWELYNEAYTHAAGKWQAIQSLKSPLMAQVSPEVLRRLERANLDLLNRQHNVNQRLEEFEFPALFAGVAGSSEFKDVRFNRWKTSFSRMRGFTLDYYKGLFGAWPPKARSKKNPFSESGLNRLVLKALYADLCSLYDLLVDRDSLTPRVIDQPLEDVSDKEDDQNIKALRKMLTEFEQSSPPVLPPIPFDIPRIPTMRTVQAKYDDMKEKERLKFDRNIKEYELQLILHKSYNFDTDSINTAFLEQFKAFDADLAKGKSSAEIVDTRLGIWLFLYVVIQSLPLLVIDAPDLQFTEGVEYFLCQPPMGNAPWIEDAGAARKAWYQVPGSDRKVELSADVVMFSVEGTYERSHCWEAAKQWDAARLNGGNADLLGLPPPPGGLPACGSDPALMPLSPLQPPGAVFEDMDPIHHQSNSGSPASSAPGSPAFGPQRRSIAAGSGLAQGRGSGSAYRSSFAGVVGLEMLPSLTSTTPVDRRSSRVYSAQMSARSDSIMSPRPQSASGFHAGDSPAGTPPPPPSDTPKNDSSNHTRAGSSTFDDILKDLGQNQGSSTKKPAKKKFGL